MASDDDLLIAALAAGSSYSETADRAGCSAKTVQRRMAEPDFAQAVAAARGERVDRVTGQLADMGATAAAVLRAAMGEDQPMKVRLAAATTSLRQLRDFRSAGELERRLQEVEEVSTQLAALAGGQRTP